MRATPKPRMNGDGKPARPFSLQRAQAKWRSEVRETLEALLERVEKAEGPNKKLDHDVFLALHPEFRSWGGSMYVPSDEPDNWAFTDAQAKAFSAEWEKLPRPTSEKDDVRLMKKHATPFYFDPANPMALFDGERFPGGSRKNPNRRYFPPITASIDAAVALVEKMLPGWDYLVCRLSGGPAGAEVGPPDSFQQVKADGATPALALIAALLRALIATDAAAPIKPSEKEG